MAGYSLIWLITAKYSLTAEHGRIQGHINHEEATSALTGSLSNIYCKNVKQLNEKTSAMLRTFL